LTPVDEPFFADDEANGSAGGGSRSDVGLSGSSKNGEDSNVGGISKSGDDGSRLGID
jgi:hypothetical protein